MAMKTLQKILNKVFVTDSGGALSGIISSQNAMNAVVDDENAALRINLIGGGVGGGGLGLTSDDVVLIDTETVVTLTADQVNKLIVIDNTSAVSIDASAAFIADNIYKEWLIWKINTGGVTFDPGAAAISGISGGAGYVRNTSAETMALIRVMILSTSLGGVLFSQGSWEFE